jgi:hypothetical protein
MKKQIQENSSNFKIKHTTNEVGPGMNISVNYKSTHAKINVKLE